MAALGTFHVALHHYQFALDGAAKSGERVSANENAGSGQVPIGHTRKLRCYHPSR